MSGSKTTSRKRRRRRKTPAEIPFRKLVEQDMELKNLHAQYASLPVEERRRAAQWALDSSHASMLMAEAINKPDLLHPAWHDAAAPLAIDPEYAPAMLTVGSLEYQYGRVEEAMALFLKLTTLPADTEDLQEIIDKAGGFLIDQGDHVNAGQLYAAAVRAYPQVPLYHVGMGYCTAEGGRMDESVAHHRLAVELEPHSYLHLNDLGYSLLEAGQYDEAEEVLQRAVQLAPPDYDLARGNVEHLRKVRSGDPQGEDWQSHHVLTEAELDEALARLPSWEVRDDWLRRTFTTPGWPHTVMLVSTIGYLAEAAWYHPDLSVGYAKVTVKLQTHRVRAVTYNDVELAVRIQEVVLWTPPEESALDGFPKRWVH